MLTLRKLHALLGALPLTAFGFFHAWQVSGAVRDADTFADRVAVVGPRTTRIVVIGGVLVACLAAHAALSFILARRGEEMEPTSPLADPALRVAHHTFTLMTLAFVVWHVLEVGGALYTADLGIALQFDAMRQLAGVPWVVLISVLGLTAMAGFIAQAIPHFAATWELVASPLGVRLARSVGALCAALVFLYAANAFAYFARGEALFDLPGTSRPAAGEEAPPPAHALPASGGSGLRSGDGQGV